MTDLKLFIEDLKDQRNDILNHMLCSSNDAESNIQVLKHIEYAISAAEYFLEDEVF